MVTVFFPVFDLAYRNVGSSQVPGNSTLKATLDQRRKSFPSHFPPTVILSEAPRLL